MALQLNNRFITVLGPVKMEVIDVTSDGTDDDSTLSIRDNSGNFTLTETFKSRLAVPRFVGIAPGSDTGAAVDTSVSINITEGNANHKLITVTGAPANLERYTITVYGM